MVRISTKLLEELIAVAAAQDEEICGLLLGSSDHIVEARPCRNVAVDPARMFEIDPAVLITAHRAARAGGPQVIGHYHSHPSGTPAPSATDAASAVPDGSYWLIIGAGAARLWRAVPGEGGTRFVESLLATD